MGFRGKVFGELITGNFAYKNGNLLYNSRVVDSNEKFSLVLVDRVLLFFLLPYNQGKGSHASFPDLFRELVAKYLRNNGADWDKR